MKFFLINLFFLLTLRFAFSQIPLENYDIKIDGLSNEKAWENASVYKLKFKKNEQMIKLSILMDSEYIYLTLKFSSPEYYENFRKWHWDSISNKYVSGDEQEENLYLVWTENPWKSKFADVWIWRSVRTRGSGYLEDAHLYSENIIEETSVKNYRPDKGNPCWKSKYYSEFAGHELQRFYFREPGRSMADIAVAEKRLSKSWNIEIRRKLSTGNSDDMEFKLYNSLYLKIVLDSPNSEGFISTGFFSSKGSKKENKTEK